MRIVRALLVAPLIIVLAVARAEELAERPGADPREAELVRQWGLEQGWTEVAVQWKEGARFPTAPPAHLELRKYTPTDPDRERGFVVFVPDRNQLRPLDHLPTPAEVAGKLKASAFPGESEPLVLGIYALQDLKRLTLDVSDLRGPQDRAISPADITLREVIYAPLSLRNRGDKSKRFAMMPLWLLPPELEHTTKGERKCWIRMRRAKQW